MRRTWLALFAMSLLFVLSDCGGGGGTDGAGNGNGGNGGNGGSTPINFKIAFIADSNIGSNADRVLNLIKSENADMVIHAGDLDYGNNPQAFENNVNGILGANYPYFFSAGNHDDPAWNGVNGYQAFLEARFNRLGIPWNGEIGSKSNFTYQGIFFLAMAPNQVGIDPSEAANYVRDQLAANGATWSIVFWHKNQQRMQVGGKGNEVGWGIYEESRRGGAIIATGHEHSYSRTHLMSHMQNQTVANVDNTLRLAIDDPATTSVDEGRSFAFVSGLGGNSIRNQQLFDLHWATAYTSSTQNATYGALFGEFNLNGDATLAYFYFKDLNGVIQDYFFVRAPG